MPPPFPWFYPYHSDDVGPHDHVIRPLARARLVGREVSAPVLGLVVSGSEHVLVAPDIAGAAVGVVSRWRPTWPMLLGQAGFLDRFTVTMSRQARVPAVEDWDMFDRRFGVVPAGLD